MSWNTMIGVGLIALALLALLSWWHSRGAQTTEGGPTTSEAGALAGDALEHLRANVRYLVWAGFHGRAAILEALPDLLEAPVDESTLESVVDAEFARKLEAEHGWPERTDCDRLDDVFEALLTRGIMALQYAGFTQSDAHGDVAEALADAESQGHEDFIGYCFYTAQDVERLIDGDRGLYLGFGTNLEQASEVEQALGAPNNVGAVEAGRVVCEVFKEHGFETRWDESASTRILVVDVDWKRRSGAQKGQQ